MYSTLVNGIKLTWGFTGRLTNLEEVKSCVGEGWSLLIENLIVDLDHLGWNGTIMQVKEKFGGLRFYIGSATDEIFKRVHQAEEDSYSICEYCSQPGRCTGPGWLRTLCDKCWGVIYTGERPTEEDFE